MKMLKGCDHILFFVFEKKEEKIGNKKNYYSIIAVVIMAQLKRV